MENTAISLVDSLMADIWPSNGAVCDFGITNQVIYGLYQKAIRRGELTAERLQPCGGDGLALTKLLKSCRSLKGQDIHIKTPWDSMTTPDVTLDTPVITVDHIEGIKSNSSLEYWTQMEVQIVEIRDYLANRPATRLPEGVDGSIDIAYAMAIDMERFLVRIEAKIKAEREFLNANI